MTATIITFPALEDRIDRESERTGAIDCTRAIGEAGELWAEALRGARSAPWIGRVEAFGRAAARVLRDRPALAGEMLILSGGAHIEFGIMGEMLEAFAQHFAARTAYQGKVGGSKLPEPANCP